MAKLGEVLIDLGYAQAHEVEVALARQAHWRRGVNPDAWRVGQVLVKLGCCDDEQVAEAIAKQAGLPYLELGSLPPLSPETLALLPTPIAVQYSVVPLVISGTELVVAGDEVLELFELVELSAAAQRPVKLSIASASAVRAALREHYGLPHQASLRDYAVEAAQALIGRALADTTDAVTVELRRSHTVLRGTWDEAEHAHVLPLPPRLQSRALEALDLLDARKAARVPATESMVDVTAGGRDMLVSCKALAERPGEATLTLQRIY